MFQFRLDVDEHRVPAADNQRNIGLKRVEMSRRRAASNPRRVKVRFVMVNAQKRFAQRKRHGFGGLQADHQRAGQPRTARGRHTVQLGRPHLCLAQGGPRDRSQITQVLASGQFRHDTAILGVELNLRRDDIG